MNSKPYLEMIAGLTRSEDGTLRMRTSWQVSGPLQVDAAAGIGDDGEDLVGVAEPWT